MKKISTPQKIGLPEMSHPYEIKEEKYITMLYCGPRIDTLPPPLVVIDGVLRELKSVNIDDIESISVLKDEEAIASLSLCKKRVRPE